jgi:hypothetical protein
VFDQPDLKAKMSLVITCPNHWKAISNSCERTFTPAASEGKFLLERHGVESFMGFYNDLE